MRIALFWEDFLHYHVARIVALQVLGARKGYRVYSISLRPQSPELPLSGYHDRLGSDVYVLRSDHRVAGPNSQTSADLLVELLNQLAPDAVLIPGYENRTALAALRWCRDNRKGAVLMTESQERDYPRKWYVERVKRALFAQFHAYLVGGERHVAYARKLGAPEELIFTKYDVVDNEFWAARADEVRRNETEWRGRLNLPGHFFLTSSRLVEKKNVSGLLCAYRQYLSAASAGAWPLIIVGDGHLRSQLERKRDELHLEGHVEFRGYLSAEELAPFYALASVFILASSHSEQWGLVVNEAMASGTPALVSDVCGCVPDLVREGVTGYSFAPDDEAGLARLLQSCSGGVFDLAAMGAAAAGRVSEYSPEAFARNALAASAAAMERSARRGRMRLLPRLTVSLVSATRS